MGRKGSYAKGVAKREEILSTALKVIAREGYDHASLRELADAVELTQAGVLHYFDSKEDLFAEVLRRRDQMDMQDHEVPAGTTSAEHYLTILESNTQVPGLVQLYVHLAAASTESQGPAREYFETRYEDFRNWVAAAILQEREQNPEFAAGIDPVQAGRIIMAVTDGLQTQWLIDPSFDLPELVGEVLKLLGVREPAARPSAESATGTGPVVSPE